MTPDSLVANNSTAQTLPANTPVVFTDNIASSGDSISHTEGDAEIYINQQGGYLLYYDGTVSGPEGASYPLTVTTSVYLNGAAVSGSSTTTTLTAAGVNAGVNGYAVIGVGPSVTLPAEVVIQADIDNVTWTYVEAIVGKTV